MVVGEIVNFNGKEYISKEYSDELQNCYNTNYEKCFDKCSKQI